MVTACPRDGRVISHGVVNCSLRRGDVGVEACFACEWLTEVRQGDAGAPAVIRCAPPKRVAPAGSVGLVA